MGILSNRVEKHEIKDGDHIYAYRTAFTYSHHGIFVGGNKVVHFTSTVTGSSSTQASWFNFSGVPNISASYPASGMSNMSACCQTSGMSNISACGPTSGISSISTCIQACGMPNISSCSSTSDMSDISVSSPNSGMSDISVSSPNSGMSNTLVSCPASYPDCGFRQPNSGVIITCLDCFLQNSSPYRFEYGVSKCVFFTRVRGGSCTTAVSDPPQTVINRAMHLLQYGSFGNYDLFQNNCEDFALFCKTGLLTVAKNGVGSSGQASSFVAAVRSTFYICSTIKNLMAPNPVSLKAVATIIAGTGTYYINRYSSDIGVRTDVIKVATEDVATKDPLNIHLPSKTVTMVEIEPTSSEQSSQAQNPQTPLQTPQTNPLQSSNHRILDPYLIHPSDNPAASLVSPQLEGDNYATWTRGMTKALNAKGKLGFVDGSISPLSSDKQLLNCWKRCDDLVSSWIIHSVHPDLRSSLMYADSARTIWNDLKVRFSQSNALQLYHLKTAITNLKQVDMSVTNYFTRLKSLWDEYDSLVSSEPCICGASKFLIERHERDRAMEFLQGLHDRFSSIRSQILLIEPLPPAQKIFNLVKQEEAQQFISMPPAPSKESAALQVKETTPHRHSFNKRHRRYCDHCNKYGHTRQKCYLIHGFPPSKPKGSASIPTVAAVTLKE